MADLAAKRMEARRRRILENSEDRLKRITGLYSISKDDDTNPERAPLEATSTKEQKTLPSAEVPRIEREVPVNRDIQSYMETPPAPENVPITDDSLWQHTNHETNDTKQSSLFPGFQQEPQLQQTVIHPFIRLRLHIVALAIIIRTLLSSPFSFLIGQSAVIPLLTLELVDILGDQGTGADPQGGVSGVFGLSLVLAGLPYKRIKQVVKTFTIFNHILEDFSIYFFVFVVTHVFLKLFSFQ